MIREGRRQTVTAVVGERPSEERLAALGTDELAATKKVLGFDPERSFVVDDDVTVKTLQRKGAVVELLPANPDYAPIVIDTRRAPVVIEGVMVGLIRKDH